MQLPFEGEMFDAVTCAFELSHEARILGSEGHLDAV